MNTDEIMKICNQVREKAYAIHMYHGNGYLEKMYENALANRLRKAGFEVSQQHRLVIHDEDGSEIGEYFADLLIGNELIIELKACKCVTNEHKAQLIHYLKGSGIEHGLLINFGSGKFFIKKYVKSKKHPSISRYNSLILSFFALSAFFRG